MNVKETPMVFPDRRRQLRQVTVGQEWIDREITADAVIPAHKRPIKAFISNRKVANVGWPKSLRK